jgi:hypothetical protein
VLLHRAALSCIVLTVVAQFRFWSDLRFRRFQPTPLAGEMLPAPRWFCYLPRYLNSDSIASQNPHEHRRFGILGRHRFDVKFAKFFFANVYAGIVHL